MIGAIAATQSAKSVLLQCALADQIDQDPGTAFYILPDRATAQKHLEEKIISVIQSTPDLAKHLTEYVRDVSKNNIRLDHMTIYPAWAGSIASMNSFPAKRVYWDEVRLMDLSIGNESNAIKLGQDRLTTYLAFGIGQGFMVSSPSTEGDLLYQQVTVPGTLYLCWQIQCQSCGEYQELDFFKNVKFDSSTKTVSCNCINCNAPFDDTDRKKGINATGKYAPYRLEDGKFIATRINNDGTLEVPYDISKYKRVFFHWSSMESPFRSWARIWREFLDTRGKIQDYKNFIQCWLARFWVEDKSKSTMTVLKSRVVDFEKGDVPEWTKILTAGLDTQDKGFYYTVRAWGDYRRSHMVESGFIPSNMSIANAKDIVTLFNSYLFDKIYLTPGLPSKATRWKIAMAAIDIGGHRTKQVYLASESLPRLILCKGIGDTQKTTIEFNNTLGIYLVRTSEYLDETDEGSTKEYFTLHYDPDAEYLAQFCSVRKQEIKNKRTGETKVQWTKLGPCDYRFAEIHNYILLDIPTTRGVLRNLLDQEKFIWNPIAEERPISNNSNTGHRLAETNTGSEGEFILPSFNW